MIDDPNVDVIYNPLPNGLHFEWTMKALKGGKHVLLEQPATDTAAEAVEIYALATRKNLVVLEAFHYRLLLALLRRYPCLNIYPGSIPLSNVSRPL
jgi:predicted dehydrogenase